MILGQHYNANVVASFRVGDGLVDEIFPQGQFTARAFRIAEIAARPYWTSPGPATSPAPGTWPGASGTWACLRRHPRRCGGNPRHHHPHWTGTLLLDLLRAQSADQVRMDGLKEDRRAVIGGGVSLLRHLRPAVH